MLTSGELFFGGLGSQRALERLRHTPGDAALQHIAANRSLIAAE